MMIGEFGSVPSGSPASKVMASGPIYWLYEMGHAALNPARAIADATRLFYRNPVNPLSHTTFGKSMAAAAEFTDHHAWEVLGFVRRSQDREAAQ